MNPLGAIVVQRTGRGRTCDAGNRAQILVDCFEVVIAHVLVSRPGHYLEKVATERMRKAVRGYSSRTIWMEMIKVRAMPNNFKKL